MQHLLLMSLRDESPGYPRGGGQIKAMSYLYPLNETSEIVKTRRQFGMSIAVTQCVQL